MHRTYIQQSRLRTAAQNVPGVLAKDPTAFQNMKQGQRKDSSSLIKSGQKHPKAEWTLSIAAQHVASNRFSE